MLIVSLWAADLLKKIYQCFLVMYCYFPVIQLDNFVLFTVVALQVSTFQTKVCRSRFSVYYDWMVKLKIELSLTPNSLHRLSHSPESLVSTLAQKSLGCQHLKVTSSQLKGTVSQHSSLFLFNFANHSPSITMELKVSKEITCKWQNQRSETNKYVSWALFLKLQAKSLFRQQASRWTVFKNPNFNAFQSSLVLPVRAICCFCYVILTLL